ncbi:hypothetical protein GS415_00655 [Rhodococcus hoagii]|nr:hypothetical protein [Prescottella equi]
MKADAMAKTKGILSRKRQLVEIFEMDPETAALNESELIQESMLIDGTGTAAPQQAPAEQDPGQKAPAKKASEPAPADDLPAAA